MKRVGHVVLACLLLGCGDRIAPYTPPEDAAGAQPTLGGACAVQGALDCNGEGQALQLVCDGGRWANGGICGGQQLCDARTGPTKGTCQPAIDVCVSRGAGWSYCAGAVRKTCSASLLSTTDETCGSEAQCAASTGPHCPACATGEHRCNGSTLLTCQKGAFVTQQECADAASCNAAAGLCGASICTVGVYRCDGAALQKCGAGGTAWSTVAICGGDCNAATHTCDACPAGVRECVGNTPRHCDATGVWVGEPACGNGCKDGDCVP